MSHPRSTPRVLNDADIPMLLPVRPADSHKGLFGRVRVLAGCRDMPGAAVLCCMAAYRAGAGLVEACVIRNVARAIHAHLPEAITKTLPGRRSCGLRGISAYAKMTEPDILLLGPGMGSGFGLVPFMAYAVGHTSGSIVIDADGLRVFAACPRGLNKPPGKVIITPHPGEMSRLTGLSVREIVTDPAGVASDFAQRHSVTVLLKGHRTVIAHPDGGLYVNPTGHAALAKAGAGDALSGIIAGLMAQGVPLPQAGALGAYLHGKAGELAAEKLSLYGVNASDVIAALPAVLKRYEADPSF